MKEQHGVTLLESDMQEIKNIVCEQELEQCNIPVVSNNEVAVCCSNCKNDYNKDFHKICKHCYLGSKFEAN